MISWVLYFSSIIFFVASFDVEDMIEKLSMVTININSGQDTATFSADTWKMTLYDPHLLEQGKGIEVSRSKLVD